MSSEVQQLRRFKIDTRYDSLDDRDYAVTIPDVNGGYVRHEDATAAIEAVRAQWAAEVTDLADVLHRNGFARCDIAACNCGSWHARFGYPERFREFTETLEEHGARLHAGKTALAILKEMLVERDSAQAEAKLMREALIRACLGDKEVANSYIAALQPGAQP